MSLAQQCEAVFGTRDLYGVLGVQRGAAAQEIRRGYHRASLRLHPDRVPAEQKEEATRRFQVRGDGGKEERQREEGGAFQSRPWLPSPVPPWCLIVGGRSPSDLPATAVSPRRSWARCTPC